MDLLLQAFAQVRRRQPGMKSLIVGSGPMRPELEALRRDLGLEQDCILRAGCGRLDARHGYLCVVLLVGELPNALLEAMACGCCVIGSDVGGVGEMIEHQRSGLVFQSGDVAGLAESLLQAINQKVGGNRWARPRPAERGRGFQWKLRLGPCKRSTTACSRSLVANKTRGVGEQQGNSLCRRKLPRYPDHGLLPSGAHVILVRYLDAIQDA
jgi:glycosyltransferase involved in cell wall biosynthesis